MPGCENTGTLNLLLQTRRSKDWEIDQTSPYSVPDHSPWYVVPADDKENTRLIVSQIVLDTLGGLEMAYPKASAGRRKELLAVRKRLVE